MVDHLTAVAEETENQMTAAETTKTNGQDEHGHGEKFRVDRRKLEQMLQEKGDESGLTADEFFNQVMRDSETVISWPTKLKIGAKSKKDPHIKIAGLPENIKKAKDMVAVKLESKANRVTLKMDVSHTDHSHIIGRRGQNINKVMVETNCHIHFPDSNRGSAGAEKSNQVSITGQPEGVEKARARIREMLPLVLCFEIPNYDNMFLPFDPMLPSIQSIAQQYEVTFSTKGRTQVGIVVAVRGSQDRVAYIQQAMTCLCKQLTGSSELPSVVQLHLDVAPQHHIFMVGQSARNIREIMEQTAAKIEIPDPRMSSRNGMITITGSIPAVIQARAMLVNCLPLLLMFDLKEEEAKHLLDQPEKVNQIENKFFVSIGIKAKPKQTSKSVTIKSKESNVQNMYFTRLEILGNPMDPQVMQHPPPLTVHLPHSSTPWFATLQSPYTSPLASPTPHSIRSDSPSSFTRRISPPHSLGGAPPGFNTRPPWRQHHRSESFNNGDYQRLRNSTEIDHSKVVRSTASEGGSPNESFEIMSRRNSEPTSYADAWKSSTYSSQNKAPGSPARNSPPSVVANNKPRFALLDGIKNAGSHRLLDSHGSNPSSSFGSLASASLNIDLCLDSAPQSKFADYERKKGMSTELMTRKVAHPQVRVPTDLWSGLHLSKSADFEALKKNDQAKAQKEALEAQSSSTEARVTPTLHNPNPTVRRDLSASMQVSRSSNVYRSPFSPKASGNLGISSNSGLEQMQLDEVLRIFNMEEFSEKFRELEVTNVEIFTSLTKDDLKEAGFEPLGVRKKIENAIAEMKKAKDDMLRKSVAHRSENYRFANHLEVCARSGRF